MSLKINTSYAINSKQQLSVYEDGCGFVFKDGKIEFDFHYELYDEGMLIVLNDDASWAYLSLEDNKLMGTLYSYLVQPKMIEWVLESIDYIAKPKAHNSLQAVRFHDLSALQTFTKEIDYSELLIEAATCGHLKMLEYCLDHGASLHVNIESFHDDEKEACFALTKAIIYGHVEIVKKLLEYQPRIHPHYVDIHRDNFYQATTLYQSRPDVAEEIIELLLAYGVDFSVMSAYYLTSVMYVFDEGPLGQTQADTKMLQKLLDSGADKDAYMLVQIHEEDTPFMFAAHMGLLEPLKLLQSYHADLYKSFEGVNALDRAVNPIVKDPQMPFQGSLEVQSYLKSLGLVVSLDENLDDIVVEKGVKSENKLPISTLEELFNNKK
jgi:hypothetical protein